MNEFDGEPASASEATGLCARCRFLRAQSTKRGAVFFLVSLVRNADHIHTRILQWIGGGAFLPTTIANSCVAAANIAANAVLIPKFSMIGAVWASLVSYFGIITVLVQAYYAWLCEKKSRNALRGNFIS